MLQAQQDYFHENYEEALVLLQDLGSQYPDSSQIAYYLGMTYKRLQDYRSAEPFLEKACTLAPRVDEALPEFVELLYQNNKLDKAREWIGAAERDFVAPGQTAFLKGLVLLKQKEYRAAIKAFDDAAALDHSLVQNVAYQKAVALSQTREYGRAREQLRSVVIKDPGSDLAVFADEYIDSLKRQQEAAKTLKGAISYAVQYDDNVVFEPTDSSLSSDTTHEGDLLQAVSFQTEWQIKPVEAEKTALNAVYSFYGTKHDTIGLYDSHNHDLSLQPAYYGQAVTLALPLHYNYVTLNEDPYLDTAGASGLVNFNDAYNRLWQMQLQYNHNDYHWTASGADDNRDSHDMAISCARYWFWNTSGYFNLQYAFNYNDASGRNWEYSGNRLMLTVVVPLRKGLSWNCVLDLLHQQFANSHTSYYVRRRDKTMTVSNLLAKELWDGLQLQAQHTCSYDESNIEAYKYRKNVYSVGLKFRF